MPNILSNIMNVSFLKDEPLNTVIINSSDGRPLYEVQTPWKLFQGGTTTTVRRLTPGVASGAGEIVAEVHRHTFNSSTIRFSGSTMQVKDWLKEGGIFSSSRRFTANDGISYKWTHGSGKFTLKNANTKLQVAQSHRRKKGWFGGTPRKMNIDISPQGMHFLDVIVVSFIIMEEKHRRAKERAAIAASSSSANAAAAG